MRISDWSSDVCSSDLTNLSLLLFFFLFAEGLSTVKRPLVALAFCVLLFLFFALLFCSGRNITKNGRSKRNRRGTRRLSFSIRSEEHTSELQSLMRISYAVFCLKKKKTTSADRYKKQK